MLNMNKIIAERRVIAESIEDGSRKEVIVRIGLPYWDDESQMAQCPREYFGLLPCVADAFGADTVQALALALDVDAMLRAHSSKYRFYWTSGEPYFE